MTAELDLFTGLPNERAVMPAHVFMPPTVTSLVEWATQADAAYRLAERLSRTSFVPQQFRGKPEEAAAAILSGAEVGLSPMASLGAFDVIQGQARPKAMTLRAVAQGHGCEIVMDEANEAVCRMRGRRRGDAEWTTVKWDLKRAQALGLLQKDQWRKQPTAMLIARATSELCRLIAADAVLGIGYSSEEMADQAVESEPQRTARRRAQREPAPMPEPTLEPEPEAVAESQPEPPADAPDPITADQLKAVNAGLTSLGITDRDTKLATVAQVIDREIGSSKDLTKAEASRVLDWIKFEEQRDRQGELPEPELEP